MISGKKRFFVNQKRCLKSQTQVTDQDSHLPFLLICIMGVLNPRVSVADALCQSTLVFWIHTIDTPKKYTNNHWTFKLATLETTTIQCSSTGKKWQDIKVVSVKGQASWNHTKFIMTFSNSGNRVLKIRTRRRHGSNDIDQTPLPLVAGMLYASHHPFMALLMWYDGIWKTCSTTWLGTHTNTWPHPFRYLIVVFRTSFFCRPPIISRTIG